MLLSEFNLFNSCRILTYKYIHCIWHVFIDGLTFESILRIIKARLLLFRYLFVPYIYIISVVVIFLITLPRWSACCAVTLQVLVVSLLAILNFFHIQIKTFREIRSTSTISIMLVQYDGRHFLVTHKWFKRGVLWDVLQQTCWVMYCVTVWKLYSFVAISYISYWISKW